MRGSLGLLLALAMLTSCAPQATVADPDRAVVDFFRLDDRGDLAVTAQAPIEDGTVLVAGPGLVLESPYCDLPGCAASPDGYIRLTYPDEPDADYTRRLEIAVLSGTPTQGRALMTLAGDDNSRPAPLRRPVLRAPGQSIKR